MDTGKLLEKPKNLQGVIWEWTSIPSRWSRNIPSPAMLQKPGQALAAMSQPAQRLHFSCDGVRNLTRIHVIALCFVPGKNIVLTCIVLLSTQVPGYQN